MSDRIEVAATGRASCRGCKRPIAKGELRFGEVITSASFDASMALWYHLACAAAKRPDRLRPVLAKYKQAIPDRASIEASLAGSVHSTRIAKLLWADRAPTGRAKCQHCKRVIEKATLRAGLLLDHDPTMPGTGFLHLACAPVYAGASVTTHLTAKSKKLGKADRAAMMAVLRAVELLETDGRGRQLGQAAAAATAKVDPPEVSVLSDWLEERGCVLDRAELVQMLKTRAG